MTKSILKPKLIRKGKNRFVEYNGKRYRIVSDKSDKELLLKLFDILKVILKNKNRKRVRRNKKYEKIKDDKKQISTNELKNNTINEDKYLKYLLLSQINKQPVKIENKQPMLLKYDNDDKKTLEVDEKKLLEYERKKLKIENEIKLLEDKKKTVENDPDIIIKKSKAEEILKNINDQIDKLNEQKRNLNIEITKLRFENNSLTVDNIEKNKIITEQKEETKKVAASIILLNNRIKKFNDKIEKNKIEIESANMKIEYLKSQRDELNESNKKERERLNNEITDLQKEKDKLLNENKSINTDLIKTKDDLNKEIDNLKKSQKENQELKDNIENQLKDTQLLKKNLEDDINNLKEEKEKLKESLNDKTIEADQFKSENKGLNEEIKKKTNTLNELNKQIEELKNNSLKYEEENKIILNTLGQTKLINEDLKKEKNELNDEVKKIKDELTKETIEFNKRKAIMDIKNNLDKKTKKKIVEYAQKYNISLNINEDDYKYAIENWTENIDDSNQLRTIADELGVNKSYKKVGPLINGIKKKIDKMDSDGLKKFISDNKISFDIGKKRTKPQIISDLLNNNDAVSELAKELGIDITLFNTPSGFNFSSLPGNIQDALKGMTNKERRKYLTDLGYGYLLGPIDPNEDLPPYTMNEEEKKKFDTWDETRKKEYYKMSNTPHLQKQFLLLSDEKWNTYIEDPDYTTEAIKNGVLTRNHNNMIAERDKEIQKAKEAEEIRKRKERYGFSGNTNELKKLPTDEKNNIVDKLKSHFTNVLDRLKQSGKFKFKDMDEYKLYQDFFKQYEVQNNLKLDAGTRIKTNRKFIEKYNVPAFGPEADKKYDQLKKVFDEIKYDTEINELVEDARYLDSTIKNSNVVESTRKHITDDKNASENTTGKNTKKKYNSLLEEIADRGKNRKDVDINEIEKAREESIKRAKENIKDDTNEVHNKIKNKFKSTDVDDIQDDDWGNDEQQDESQKETQKETQDESQQETPSQEGNGKMISNRALSNFEIEDMMRKYNKNGFKGVYALDMIDKIKLNKNDNKFSFIMNTLPSTSNIVGHWVAVNINGDTIEYFDSFGENPDKSFLPKLAKILRKWKPGNIYQLKINNVKWQKDNSNRCGWHSMRFLIDRYNGKSFKEATKFKIIENAIVGEKEVIKFQKGLDQFKKIKI